MKQSKRKKLEAKGWKVGDAKEFLGLSEKESRIVDIKIALARHVRVLRKKCHMGQVELAKRIGSSQSRVAKIEAADDSVTIDRMIRASIEMGASRKELGKIIAGPSV